ncbi:MAG: carbohydrate ABC transporter permease [Conexibacter sp.]
MSRRRDVALAADAPASSVRPSRRLLVHVFMIVVLAYFLLPLVWVTLSATKDSRDLFGTFGLWFGHSFDLVHNLDDLFTKDDGVYGQWLLNTVWYSGVSAIGAAIVSAMGGYALAKYRFRGRRLVMALTIGSIMIPPQTLVLPTFLLFAKANLTGTALSVILPMTVSPVGIFLMKVYAESAVPDELIDAARVDGTGDVRIFWTIAFRLLMPGIVTVFLLTFVANWNNFFLPLVMLSDDRAYPVTVGLTIWNALATHGQDMSYTTVIAGSLLAIVPVLLVFVTMQRYWESGLALGSGK